MGAKVVAGAIKEEELRGKCDLEVEIVWIEMKNWSEWLLLVFSAMVFLYSRFFVFQVHSAKIFAFGWSFSN